MAWPRGRPAHNRGARYSAFDVHRASMLYVGGLSVREVAQAMGVRPTTVTYHFDRIGFRLRSRSLVIAERNQRNAKHRHVVSGKYVKALARWHPRADGAGYVFEHILVAETMLGRYLERGEEPHHIDRNGLNNDPANIAVAPDRRTHARWHSSLSRVLRTLQAERQDVVWANLSFDPVTGYAYTTAGWLAA